MSLKTPSSASISKPNWKTNWNHDSRVELLRELVEIDSGTSNVPGVQAVQERVARELHTLGLSVRWETSENPEQISARFLIAQDGEPHLQAAPVVTLVTHADTVFELTSGFHGFRIQEDAARAFGPGVIDDKGGIVVAIEALRRWLARVPAAERSLQVRILVAPNEETGSPGFHSLLKKQGQESWMALGLEPALDDGSIVKSRRGNRWYAIQVQGRAAHSGRHPKHGINAAHELAFKLVALHHLGQRHPEVTLSTGSIQGGEAGKFNIVCGQAQACLDFRFSDFESRDQIHSEIERILSSPAIGPADDGALPQASYQIADDCPPVPVSTGLVHPAEIYAKIVEKLENRPVTASHSGGAADVNYMSRPGLLILDGLGPYGGGMHRPDEFIELSSLETRAEALVQFLMNLNTQAWPRSGASK